jgi:hypothetical protein
LILRIQRIMTVVVFRAFSWLFAIARQFQQEAEAASEPVGACAN